MKRILVLLLAMPLVFACQEGGKKGQAPAEYSFTVTNFSDAEYPDNPDIGYRSSDYQQKFFTSGKIDGNSTIIDIGFFTDDHDTVHFDKLDISEFIPTIPDNIKRDEYLSHISCINQEWNRNQVSFSKDYFSTTEKRITRVDIARNCLNAYLWEIIAYTEENNAETPFAHGWFEFPRELYAQLFQQKNNIPFEKYKKELEVWIPPANKVVDFSQLREVLHPLSISYADSSNMMYPVAGERKRKLKGLLFPPTFQTMKDLQSDSTLFATFSPPGFYDKNNPRATELGRFYTLANAELNLMKSTLNGDTLHELVLFFHDKTNARTTKVYLGGLQLQEFPVLPVQEANNAWKKPMGIANHTFYEDYPTQLAKKTNNNPYYGLITDGNNAWLDSHAIGIDGPMIHFTDQDRTELHVWFLSFERHAFAGHYVIHIQ